MSTVSPTAPSLADFVTRINTEFAAIQKADQDANKSVVQRAISFGRTLSQAQEKVGPGKWVKWLNDNCSAISRQSPPSFPKLRQWTMPDPSPAIVFAKMVLLPYVAFVKLGGRGMVGSTRPRQTRD